MIVYSCPSSGKPFFQRPFLFRRLRGGQLLSTIASSSMMYNKVWTRIRVDRGATAAFDLICHIPVYSLIMLIKLQPALGPGLLSAEPVLVAIRLISPSLGPSSQVVSKLGLLDTSRTAWESDDHDAVSGAVGRLSLADQTSS
jgi:hypothetical protein